MEQLRIPGDPHGIAEPHDVLAADEFAMPSGPDRIGAALTGGGGLNPLMVLAAAALALLVYSLVKQRR
jgi:hypothetical protein